jgi:acylphosphatase
MKKSVKFIVKGTVQGVGYRYFTQHCADSLGIYGYVMNKYNGDVEVYAIGSEEQLSDLKSYLLKGPSMSRVENVIEEPATMDNGIAGFSVEY